MSSFLRPFFVALAAALLTTACGRSVVLAAEDGKEWDGHLAVGQTLTFSAEVVDKGGLTPATEPATRITVDDPSVVTLGTGMYGYTLLGVTRGETTLHVFAPGDDTPSDTAIVVE